MPSGRTLHPAAAASWRVAAEISHGAKFSMLPIFRAGHSAIVHGPEQMLEKPLRRVEEVASDQEMLRFAIGDLPDGVSVEIKEDRIRVAKENGRVTRDEKLRLPRCCEVVDDLEERQLPLRRKRRLRLIQD